MADNSIIPHGAVNSPYNNTEIAPPAEKASAGAQTSASSDQPSRPRSELSGSLGAGRSFFFLPEIRRNGNLSAEGQIGDTVCKFQGSGGEVKMNRPAENGAPLYNPDKKFIASEVKMDFTAGNGDRLRLTSTPGFNGLSAQKFITPNLSVAGNFTAHSSKPADNSLTAGVLYESGGTSLYAGYIDTGKNCSMAPAGIEGNFSGLEGPLYRLDQQIGRGKARVSITKSQYGDPNLPYVDARVRIGEENSPLFSAGYTKNYREERPQKKGEEFVSYSPSETQYYRTNFPLAIDEKGQQLTVSGGFERHTFQENKRANEDIVSAGLKYSSAPGKNGQRLTISGGCESRVFQESTGANEGTVSAGLNYSSPGFSVMGKCHTTSRPNDPRRNTSGAEVGIDWKKAHLGYTTENGVGWSNTTTEASYAFNENISANYSRSENRPGNRSKEALGVKYQNPKSDLNLGLKQENESCNGQTSSKTSLDLGLRF